MHRRDQKLSNTSRQVGRVVHLSYCRPGELQPTQHHSYFSGRIFFLDQVHSRRASTEVHKSFAMPVVKHQGWFIESVLSGDEEHMMGVRYRGRRRRT